MAVNRNGSGNGANHSTVATVAPNLTSYSRHFLNKRVAVFGPNYIWTGKFVDESDDAIVLENVSQIYETNKHTEAGADMEWIADVMVFPKCAICNMAVTRWAQKLPEVPAEDVDQDTTHHP